MVKALVFIVVIVILGGAFYALVLNNPLASKLGEVQVGSKVFKVEIADSPEERERGLSNRDSLGGADGMLFVFQSPAQYQFWMKDTRIDLDIIWISPESRILGYSEAEAPPPNTPENELVKFLPPDAILYALEMPRGSAERFNFDRGQSIKITLP